MIAFSSLVRERLDGIEPYRPGAAPPDSGAGKLSSNESFVGPSPSVADALTAILPTLSRYPDGERLARLLAEHDGVSRDQVILTNGSDELCALIGALLLGRGSKVVMSDPGYRIDETVTRLQLAVPATVALRHGRHDLERLALAARGAALLWLPNPHNPTGTAVAPDELDTLFEAVPDSCLVVLDEAYRPFMDPALRPDVQRLLARHANLLVQRTFSKAHGLAGLRLGYGLGSAELVGGLQAMRMPFSVNAAALAAAEAALRDPGWTERAVAATREARDRFEAFLTARRIAFWPSQANFVTLRHPSTARLHERLAAVGVTVRDGADLGYPGWVRVTMGAPEEMALVQDAIEASW